MPFCPHTLEEQKALLTAEAEGKTIFWLGNITGMRRERADSSKGTWHFSRIRYEVEQPLMECWANVYGPGAVQFHTAEEQARRHANADVVRTAVHMREVRATQGPTP